MLDKLAFLDLDGVLCDDRHRVEHALNKNWTQYFFLLDRDAVWPQGKELHDALIMCGYDIVYLTGRREDTRRATVQWLKRNGFDYKRPLVMRPLPRYPYKKVPLCEFKYEVVWEVAELYDEVVIYDDDPSVIEECKKIDGIRAEHCTWYIKPERMIRKATT